MVVRPATAVRRLRALGCVVARVSCGAGPLPSAMSCCGAPCRTRLVASKLAGWAIGRGGWGVGRQALGRGVSVGVRSRGRWSCGCCARSSFGVAHHAAQGAESGVAAEEEVRKVAQEHGIQADKVMRVLLFDQEVVFFHGDNFHAEDAMTVAAIGKTESEGDVRPMPGGRSAQAGSGAGDGGAVTPTAGLSQGRLTFGMCVGVTAVAFESIAVTTALPRRPGDLGHHDAGTGGCSPPFRSGCCSLLWWRGGCATGWARVRPLSLGMAIFAVRLIVARVGERRPGSC